MSEENKNDLALDLANSPKHIIDLSCPRGTLNPGLYFGFIKGWEAREEEIKRLKTWNQLLTSYHNECIAHIEQLESNTFKSKLKALYNEYWLFFQRSDIPWYIYLP